MTRAVDSRAEYPLGAPLDFLQRLWQLNHALERLSSRMEKTIGVTAQQRLIIRCVGKYPGIAAGQLAAVLHVDAGTVSAALKRLEEKRLLVRGRDPRDKRRTTLGLTPAGRAMDRPDGETAEGAVERLLIGAKAAHIATARQILERLTALLEESDPSE